MEQSKQQLRMCVYASLLAALTAAGAFMAIPIGPVPIVLQNLFIMLSGLLLGSRWGFASVAIYLLAGACGLPVFAGGTGGIGKFIGPTGGYLIGFLPAVYGIGWISEYGWNLKSDAADSDLRSESAPQSNIFSRQMILDVIAIICGTIMIYAFGVTWLTFITKMTFSKAIAVGMFPFLPGDVLKIAAAIPIANILRPMIQKS